MTTQPLGLLHRVLIRVYPPRPRRSDLLDSLHAAAAASDGRRRPDLPEAFDLLAHGLGARLRRPATFVTLIVAAVIAVPSAAVGSAATGWLAVHTAHGLPTGEDARALKDTLLPGLPVAGRDGASRIVAQGDGEGIEYGYASYSATHTTATRDVVAYTTAARDRLSAGGWHVTGQTIAGTVDLEGWTSSEFTATKNGLTVRFSDEYDTVHPSWDSDGQAGYIIWSNSPAGMPILATLGMILGAATGLFLTAWAASRLRGRGTAAWAAGSAAAVYTFLMLPFLKSVGDFTEQEAQETIAPFFNTYLRNPLPILAVVAAAISLLIAFRVGRATLSESAATVAPASPAR